MIKKPKISLIGGGNIGGTLTHIAAKEALGNIVLFDLTAGKAKGKALDIAQTATIENSDVSISGTNKYEDIADSDVIIVTAGVARKPGMSRDDLISINAGVMKTVGQGIKKYAPNAFAKSTETPEGVPSFSLISNGGYANSIPTFKTFFSVFTSVFCSFSFSPHPTKTSAIIDENITRRSFFIFYL